MFNKIKNRITGFSGIEILLAGSIMALVITSLLGLLFYSNDALNKDNSNLQASLIASQALEVVSTIRDRGFDNLIDGVHGLSFSGGEWSFLGESDQVGDFTRVITISTVSENVKKIAVLVTWFKSPGRLVSISEYRYLTNWQETEQASLIDVAINIDSDWEDGYCATVTLTTESITPIIWDLDIILDTYPKNGIVNNVWDANWSFAEPILSVSGLAGNETIVFGSSINFTYCADREIIPPPLGQANYLEVNTINSRVNPVNKNQVIGTELLNTSSAISIILEEIVVNWSGVNANTRISSIQINGTTLWSGSATSGSTLTLSSPFVLGPLSGPYSIVFNFSKKINGIDFYTRFIMEDFSEKLVDIFAGGGADLIPPGTITNLSSTVQDHESVTLSWTAPGDDGMIGLASYYEIRYSQNIIDDSNWDLATIFSTPPSPEIAGTIQSAKVSGLSLNTNYYFAIKTYDESANVSLLSNVLNASTTNLSDSSYLYLNIGSAVLGPPPLSNNYVSGIILDNNGLSNISITGITGSWGSDKIKQIYIDGISVWNRNISSGAIATFSTPYVLTPSGGPYNLSLRFQKVFTGKTIDYLDIILGDGSVKRSDSKSF
ncbi:cellulose binding domain-containing protein [Patescibacteria group bacterium]|nr:cellulose binding domain-containing protein [Patescibacteria group bacterium]